MTVSAAAAAWTRTSSARPAPVTCTRGSFLAAPRQSRQLRPLHPPPFIHLHPPPSTFHPPLSALHRIGLTAGVRGLCTQSHRQHTRPHLEGVGVGVGEGESGCR